MRPASRAPHRVAITGVGLLTPAGGCFDKYWESINGEGSLLRGVTCMDAGNFPCTIVGEVDDGLFSAEERPGELDHVDRAVLLARVASQRAFADSQLVLGEETHDFGVCLGTACGPSHEIQESHRVFTTSGWEKLNPRTITRCMFNTIASEIAIHLGLTGTQMTVSNACASSNAAIARAYDMIAWGRHEVALAGGVETPLCPSLFGAWMQMRILSKSSDPQNACLPFDKLRKGIVLAEGAVFYIIERLERLRKGVRRFTGKSSAMRKRQTEFTSRSRVLKDRHTLLRWHSKRHLVHRRILTTLTPTALERTGTTWPKRKRSNKRLASAPTKFPSVPRSRRSAMHLERAEPWSCWPFWEPSDINVCRPR